jgi:hypothetical protein
MLQSLIRKYHYNRHIIITRYHWRVIAEQVSKPVAIGLAIVDCGDLLMRGMLFGKLGD